MDALAPDRDWPAEVCPEPARPMIVRGVRLPFDEAGTPAHEETPHHDHNDVPVTRFLSSGGRVFAVPEPAAKEVASARLIEDLVSEITPERGEPPWVIRAKFGRPKRTQPSWALPPRNRRSE